jgi:CDP-diacylglycerol--glycerol-3-phosphate 3-phosphatidyltransferase
MAVPVALAFGRLGLTPNALTIIGFAGTCAAAAAAAGQAWILAGILVLAFGIFDLFDGALARATGTASAFGAFLDSTLDRLGENIVYVGIVAGAASLGSELVAGLAGLAMATASVVTYTRARAEAVGLHGEVGIAPRPERLVVLSAGLAIAGIQGFGRSIDVGLRTEGEPWLALALAIISITSAITVIQRILHVRHQALSGAGNSSKTTSTIHPKEE